MKWSFMFAFIFVSFAAHTLCISVIYVVCHVRPVVFLSQHFVHMSPFGMPGDRWVMWKIKDALAKCFWNIGSGIIIDNQPSVKAFETVDNTICSGLHHVECCSSATFEEYFLKQ